MSWQPIATVPHSGEVLAYVPDRSPCVVVARWFAWADGSRAYLTPSEDIGDGELEATHWMPLPEMPA